MKEKKASGSRRDHIINIRLSYELKERLQSLAEKYDRTVADMVRSLLKIGIPVMEGISEAEEMMVKEYAALIRRFRKIKNIKEI